MRLGENGEKHVLAIGYDGTYGLIVANTSDKSIDITEGKLRYKLLPNALAQIKDNALQILCGGKKFTIHPLKDYQVRITEN